MQKHIQNLEEFAAFARDYAASLSGGTVVGLIGDLGAGKTTFVQEAGKALGVQKPLKSPTFILMQVEPTTGAAKERGVTQVCHVDAYRLEDERGLNKIGFDEFASDPGTVTFVEWADRIPGLKAYGGYKEVRIAIGADSERMVEYYG